MANVSPERLFPGTDHPTGDFYGRSYDSSLRHWHSPASQLLPSTVPTITGLVQTLRRCLRGTSYSGRAQPGSTKRDDRPVLRTSTS